MNIYMIIHHSHLKNNLLPYLYIGSDTQDRLLLEQYCGSSTSLNQQINYCGLSDFSKEILWQGDINGLHQLGYTMLVELEETFHQSFDVARDPRFYNKVEANTDFTTHGKAVYVYKNDPYKKKVILPTNHSDVINGLVDGFQKGKKYPKTSEQIEKLKRPFTEEHKNKISASKKGKPNPKLRKPKTDQHKAKMRQTKSQAHREKLCELNQRRQNTAIEQLNTNGKVIQQFVSIREAAEYMGDLRYRSIISDCCRGKQKTAIGYLWRYVE